MPLTLTVISVKRQSTILINTTNSICYCDIVNDSECQHHRVSPFFWVSLTTGYGCYLSCLPDSPMAAGLLEEMPNELLLLLFEFVDGLSLSQCSRVCRRWGDLLAGTRAQKIWRRRCLEDIEQDIVIEMLGKPALKLVCLSSLLSSLVLSLLLAPFYGSFLTCLRSSNSCYPRNPEEA